MIYLPDPHFFDLEMTVNGQRIQRRVPTQMRLLDFLRDELKLTGTKEVCSEGECGACTVFLDGITVNSCLIFAVEAHQSTVETIENQGSGQSLSDLQQAFVDHHSVQCGFCIPGMVLSGEQILKENPHPSREDIRYGLAGNICRCTGYQKIIDAIEDTGRQRDKDTVK